MHRIRDQGLWSDEAMVAHLRGLTARPPRHAVRFRVPNPDQFLTAMRKEAVPCWISGEYAAAAEGFDLVPERCLVYVRAGDLEAALQVVQSSYGKIAGPQQSNLEVRRADDWLYLDPDQELVERGQRLLDYDESRHIQILKGLWRRRDG